jgi:hypothetical protein
MHSLWSNFGNNNMQGNAASTSACSQTVQFLLVVHGKEQYTIIILNLKKTCKNTLQYSALNLTSRIFMINEYMLHVTYVCKPKETISKDSLNTASKKPNINCTVLI